MKTSNILIDPRKVMDKSKLMKSKSSNSASSKPNPKDRKSKSSDTLQTMIVKKRGMYVESKTSKETVNNPDNATEKENFPPRPSRGQKQFLTSVLKILSQPSTGTQCEHNTDKTKVKKKKPIKYNPYVNIDCKETAKNERKPEYQCKSKVIRNKIRDDVKFEILKARKDLVNTPSMNSDSSKIEEEELENIKWYDFLPRLVNPDFQDEAKLDKERKLRHLVREVTEGRMIKETKVKPVEEPPTLVSEQKNDKGLFNFFVDLLETTFSVYNLKAEYNASPSPNAASALSSEIALEIDESVANRLNVGADSPLEPSPSPSNHFRLKNNGLYWYDIKTNKRNAPSCSKSRRTGSPSRSPSPIKKKQMKSKSFANTKNQKPSLHAKSATNPKQSFNKDKNKKYLLNLLKEQLKMDVCPVEEPQNLYQALKVMARTKRKSHKTIRFDNVTKNDRECTFKSHKVISPQNSKSKQRDRESTRKTRCMSPKSSHFSRRCKSPRRTLESNHSLEVYNFEYDMRKRKEKSPSPADSEDNFKQYDAMLKHVLNKVESIQKAKSYSSATNTFSSRNTYKF